MHSVECLSDTKDKLGESPIWVEEENSIYWVDIKRFLIELNQINKKRINAKNKLEYESIKRFLERNIFIRPLSWFRQVPSI